MASGLGTLYPALLTMQCIYCFMSYLIPFFKYFHVTPHSPCSLSSLFRCTPPTQCVLIIILSLNYSAQTSSQILSPISMISSAFLDTSNGNSWTPFPELISPSLTLRKLCYSDTKHLCSVAIPLQTIAAVDLPGTTLSADLQKRFSRSLFVWCWI